MKRPGLYWLDPEQLRHEIELLATLWDRVAWAQNLSGGMNLADVTTALGLVLDTIYEHQVEVREVLDKIELQRTEPDEVTP